VHPEIVLLHDLHSEVDGQLRAVAQACEIVLLVVPGLPHPSNESLFVRIGHYKEGQVELLMHCFMSQLDMRLSRQPSDKTVTQFRLCALRGNTKTRTDEDVKPPEPITDELCELERHLCIHQMRQQRSPRYRESAIQRSQVRWNANTLHRLDLFAPSPRDGPNDLS
jgi:hypothetical protein